MRCLLANIKVAFKLYLMVHFIVLRVVMLMQRSIAYIPALGNTNMHSAIDHHLWKDLHVIYLRLNKLTQMQDLYFNNAPLGSLLC
jgi:hypothetical protein